VINGIESVAEDLKYHVLIYITHEIPEKEEQIIKHLLNGRVDGVLISSSGSTNNNAHYHELIQKGIPFVFFDRAIFDIDAPRVITDDYQAGFQATEHLINRECKNFVFLSLSNQMSAINHRKDGFEAALRHHHVNQSNIHILEAGTDETLSFQLIRNFLKPLPELLGIFSSVEKLAVQTYHICKEIDIQIPKQLKIISFSNLPTAALLNPALSTLTQPAFSIGKEAAKLLFQRIKNKGKIQNMTSLPQLVLNSTLFIRESTQI
jgi:LacI family transcriptional regulator